MHGHFRIRTIDRIQIQPKRFGSDQIQIRNTGAHHFYLGTRHGILMHYVREQLRRLYLNVSNFPHNAAVILYNLLRAASLSLNNGKNVFPTQREL